MSPSQPAKAFRIDADLRDAMEKLRERDGILPSEQVRRALRQFLIEKGVLPGTDSKSERKRAVTRKRP